MVTPTEWKTCYDVRTYVHTTVTTCSGHFCVIPQLSVRNRSVPLLADYP